MKLTTIKLQDFTSYAKFQEFITHLESIPSIVNFVVVGNAILLEYEAVNSSEVYYYNKVDNAKNIPIIALGRDCEASRTVTDWDLEQLEMKRMVNGQGWV
ncbi:hypothetical protein NVP1187O_247 [Vibrio phage 1.187.O._10N.286.49.F1]|nr:hypothetical protein NVP1187O_247 [Vibrio phage 1.187.O._10N.286.49.F1]